MAVDIIARGMAATADSNAEIARKISAPDYDPTETYNKNDIVFYDGKLYVCTGTNVTGAFDPAKWSQIIISDELTAVINRLAQIDNPMLIKGVVATVGDLPQNAEPGWVYFVGQEGDVEYDEYVYTEDDDWQHIGSAKIIVDSALSLTSANPVENRVITAALNTKLKSIAAAEAFDPEATYATGDYMTLDGELFRCDPNGSPIAIGDNLFVTYSEHLKNSTYGYINNKVYGSDGFHSNADTFYISGTIPLTSNASYRIVTPSYTKYNNIVASCALSSYENGNSPMNNPNTIIAYSSDGSAKTFDITATKPYLVLSVYKANESGYAVYAVSSAKFAKTTITDELDAKQDALVVGTNLDATPTASSNNPVTSGGVYTALNGKYDKDDMIPTTWEDWEAMGDEKYSDGKLYFIPGEDDPQPYKIYGFHIDPTESDPDACVSYLEDAVGMTPASMGATEFSYGTWGNAFFMPKPCMVKYDGTVDYYLDPNDYTKKADGTASDVADPNYGGNAMMQWPKIWFKFEEGLTEGEGYFYCSNKKVDNTYNCYCNIDSQNNEIDYFYTAIYIGTTANSKMRSISGVQTNATNGCGTQAGATQQANAEANNTTANIEWFMEVWSDRMLINALLILMSKSLNSQAKFGNGLVTGSQTAADAYITGTLNTKGLFWGDTTNQNQGVKVFGMENWWGHKWHRTLGLIGTSTGYLYKMTYNNYDGSTATSYNSTGSGYLTATNKSGTALVQPSNNYLNKCNYGQYGYLPIVTSSGSTSTYYSDYYYKGARFLLVGGGAEYALSAGSSYFRLYNPFSDSVWSFSASLSLKPLAPA